MTDGPTLDQLRVGQIWHRIGMKQTVTVTRVWEGNMGGVEDTYVRCQPNRGRWFYTTLDEFWKHYEEKP